MKKMFVLGPREHIPVWDVIRGSSDSISISNLEPIFGPPLIPLSYAWWCQHIEDIWGEAEGFRETETPDAPGLAEESEETAAILEQVLCDGMLPVVCEHCAGFVFSMVGYPCIRCGE